MMKVGLVGCGFMGRMHANVYSATDKGTLVRAYDKGGERLGQYCKEFGCEPCSSYEELLASDIDVVDICLPTDKHAEATVQAARAGKHVFCEKPMALTLQEADTMIAACEQAGVQLAIGHCIRFWPEYALLKQIVDDGRYGQLLSINLTRYGEFPFWSSDNWLADEHRAGGGVLDMHIHDTDFAHFLLGEPDDMVSFGTVDKRGPSQVFTTMRFGSTIVHLEGGWNLPTKTPFKMAFRAIFERGAAIMDGGPMTIYVDGGEPIVPEFKKMEAAGGGNISDLGGYYHEIDYFLSCLEEGKPLETVTPQSSRQSLATTLAEIEMIKAQGK
ncbi:MAG: Gfo/Idh/MocA family oxidoreductase [Armatimonadetes bacterium]|nr:Gfo/Idh/MocA family oxidoreductase [Armatimonadota bacterium]